MATKEEIGAALKKAHAAGDTEAAKKLAAAYKSADASSMSVGEFLKDAPRQFAIGATQAVGLRPAASAIGMAEYREGDETPSPAQGAVRMVGGAASMTAATLAFPAAAAARGATAAANVAREGVKEGLGPTLKSFAEMVNRSFVGSPGKFAVTEVSSAAGAGAAGAYVEEQGATPTQKVVAEIIGGMAVPSALAMSKLSLVGNAIRSAIKRVRTGQGDIYGPGRARAAERLKRAVPDIGDTMTRARQADVLPEAKLTLSEKAEEPGLLSLERSIIESSDELTQKSQARFAEINSVLRTSIKEVEPGEASADEARTYLDNLVQERIRIAAVKADEKIAAIGPKVTREQANALARVEIDKAYDAALAQEKELWEQVDDTLPAAADGTIDKYKSIFRSLMKNKVSSIWGDIPPRLKRLLGDFEVDENGNIGEFIPGSFSEGVTAGDLKELRSRIMEIVRQERAKDAPNRRRIGILNDLQKEALNDLQKIDQGWYTVSQSPLDRARAFSADLNARFRQGDVGDLLGFEREGGESIPFGMTLERTLGLSEMRGAMATDSLIKAVERTGNQPQMTQYMEDFLADEFLRVSKQSGDFNVPAAKRYLAQRQDVLARFPELVRRFEQAIGAGDDLIVSKGIINPKQSSAAIVLNSPPGKEIDKLVRSKDPIKAALEVKRLLETDDTGRALTGMRHAFSEWLLGRVSTNRLDAKDTPYVSGALFQEVINQPGVKSVMEVLFTKEQISRLEMIRNTALKIDKAKSAVPASEGIIGDTEGMIAETARKIIAAKTFARIGRAAGQRGDVQTPGFGVKFSNWLQSKGIDPARRLIVDAVTSPDDKLIKALLLDPNASMKQKQMAEKRLNAWMIAMIAEYGMDQSEDRAKEENVQQALSVQ